MVKTRAVTAGGGLLFASGTYVGNGAATRVFIGLTTFRPKIVYVYTQRNISNTNDNWCTHIDVVDAVNFGGVNEVWFPQWGYGANGVLDISDTGFTVASGRANINTVTYTWIAFG